MSREYLESLATAAAIEHGLPVLGFLALVGKESSWNPMAVSPVGAIGLTQLMPPTATDMGVLDPYDPWQNLSGGAAYLADCKEFVLRENRSLSANPVQLWASALACYNWGRGNWQRAYRARGNDWLCGLNPETADYISVLTPAFAKRGPSFSDCEEPPSLAGTNGATPSGNFWPLFVAVAILGVLL